MTLLLSNFVGTSWAFKGKMDNLKSEMEYYRVPEELASKVNKYYEYLWLNRKHFGDSSLLRDEDMSLSLRKELSLHLYKDMIIKVPFFQNESDDFLARVCMNLTTEIYLPHDEIVREGDVGRELYIINKGKVKVGLCLVCCDRARRRLASSSQTMFSVAAPSHPTPIPNPHPNPFPHHTTPHHTTPHQTIRPHPTPSDHWQGKRRCRGDRRRIVLWRDCTS